MNVLLVDDHPIIHETLRENEDEYVEAWEATAGQVEGTETPELPEFDECA